MIEVPKTTKDKYAALFLQTGIILIGVGTLALLLWEPHLEGRNAHVTFFEMYFKDPFLAYIYTAFIPVFVALYHAFTLSGYIGKHKVFSRDSVRALRIIKYCALVFAAFMVGAEAYLFIVQRGKDDIAGGVAMGLFMIFISIVIASAAAVFERMLHLKNNGIS